MTDIILEGTRLLVVFGILCFLIYMGKSRFYSPRKGWNWIISGFCLLVFGSFMDLTDNFQSLNQFVIIGDTELQAFLEKSIGFLGGFVVLAIGLRRWIPAEFDNRAKIEHELTQASTLLQTALISIDQGILVWDNENRVVVCNDRYHELWGYPKELLKRGTPLIDLIRFRSENGAYGAGDTEVLAQARLAELVSRRSVSKSHLITIENRVLLIRNFTVLDYEYVSICTDFTELNLLQEKLRINEAQLRAIFDNTPICLNLKDAEGRYLAVNKPYEEWFGYKADEIIGKTTREIVGVAHEIEDMEKVEKQMFDTGETIESMTSVLKSDGQLYDRILIKFPIKTSDGNVSGFGSAAVDVSELKQMERALLGAKERAEFANRTKTEFLAHMSHELRTPLNAVIGFSDMILEEFYGPVGHENYRGYIKDINDSGHHLLSMINDILDISKIEAGKLDIVEDDVEVGELIGACIKILAGRAEQDNVMLLSAVPHNLPHMKADKLRLKKILINLLSNAIKFTPEFGRVSFEANIDDSNRMVWKIMDTGIGIDADDLSRILNPFEQIRETSMNAHEGTGLGLFLTKALTESHGGTLMIDSEILQGTTVTVMFPAERTKRPLNCQSVAPVVLN